MGKHLDLFTCIAHRQIFYHPKDIFHLLETIFSLHKRKATQTRVILSLFCYFSNNLKNIKRTLLHRDIENHALSCQETKSLFTNALTVSILFNQPPIFGGVSLNTPSSGPVSCGLHTKKTWSKSNQSKMCEVNL